MKLQILIVSFVLASGIFSGAQDGMARTQFSGALSSAVCGEAFPSCEFDFGVPDGYPFGNSAGSSGSEATSDCFSGASDYDPTAAARPLACEIQHLVANSNSPSERLALPDPSYPVNKPPQNTASFPQQ